MGNMFGMFSFAFWVFSTQKCEAVIGVVPKFESACIPVRPLEYLVCHFYLEHACHACMCVTHMSNVMSQGSHMM